MKRLIFSLLFSVGLLCCGVSGFAQSNKGTEFWTAFMSHINGANSKMSLYIASDVNADYRVEFADGTLIAAGTITANNSVPVDIPSSAYLGLAEVTPNPANKKGIHITANRPIAVYAHIYDSNVSGATLLLPVSSMSKDYYSINYRQLSNMNPSYSTFAVIATENATNVRITPTQNITSGGNSVTHPAGTAYNITLDKGEVYQGASLTDLTGTHIESIAVGANLCKKIAVFSGSSKIYIGSPRNSSDNLFQQVYPTSVWGKSFVTVPLLGRAYDVFRIIYSDISAVVKVNGVEVSPSQLTGGIGYYEFATPNGSGAANIITSDKPIQVAQYAVTMGNGFGGSVFSEGDGDPEMIFLPPVEQGLRRVTLYASPFYNIQDNSFINVVIPTIAAGTFTLDGVISGTFTPVAGTPYSYAQLSVGRGSHTIAAAENFTAIAYGFAQTESYGYAAGTNLLNLNEQIVLAGVNSTTTQLNGCVNVPYYLQLTVPYQPTQIIWDPNNGSAPVTIANPAPLKTDTLANATILYTYRYPTEVQYPVGYYNATATITQPVISGADCGAEKIIDFSFYITEYPIAQFTPPTGTCAGSPVQFTDGSDPVGSVVTRWSWDFGDAAGSTSANPNTSTLQKPQHTYAVGGNYTVKLTVFNENDCESKTVSSHIVHINKNPTSKFVASNGCSGGAVTFTDQSVANEGTLTEWKWDFGDGSPIETYTSFTSLNHTYGAVNSYNVTLTVTNSNGCVNTKTMPVIVSPPPVVSFVLPDACITDVAKFTSTSTIADGTESEFTYEWNFGDPNATVAGNKSYAKNGVHLYTQAGSYNITLKVTSKYGCTDEKILPFFLNGAFPVAKFNIPGTICSSEDLVIEDESTVLPGVITKYEVYYDYDNHPELVEVYDRDNLPIPTDKLFKHNYGLFNTPVSKPYHIKIIVYSGSSANCSAVYDETISVKANPIVTLTHAFEICQENSPIQFGQQVQFNFTGTGVFTGAGVSTDGEFNPKKAGPGTHEITYIFTAYNACTYVERFNIIVYPTPIITGKRDVTINAGSQVTLEPLAVSLNGTALTYAWTPQSGLNRSDVPSPVVSPASDTQYLLTVTSANGCVAKGIFNVSVLVGPVIYNTFTPNGDSYNDTWKIPNMEYFPKATVEVFNRNGEKVFRSIGYPVPWDGRYNGATLPAGVYYYVIDLKNGKPLLSGSVTIIR
ncbi:PKD domain-containing protein [Mucilaginibacter terrae]|uniref:gliding motility-associated C-terminal domain-containing protein n=1 Tax=Mucilaginibacter terrae TaxID=1955052 RepID=UPI003642B0B4